MCGVSEFEFNHSSIDYLHARWIGWCYAKEYELRKQYEVARWQSLFVVNGNKMRPVRNVHELAKFPWEKPKQTNKDKDRLKKYGKKD